MSNAKDTFDADIALCSDDYPMDFVLGCHPDDYKVTGTPIAVEHIYHHSRGRHNRLWLRVSWAIGDGQFVAMSFLLDTGAPKHIYLSAQAMRVLEQTGTLCVDDDMDIQYVTLAGRKCPIEVTPKMHAPANLIGLKLLKRFGLRLFDKDPHFLFEEDIKFLGKDSFR